MQETGFLETEDMQMALRRKLAAAECSSSCFLIRLISIFSLAVSQYWFSCMTSSCRSLPLPDEVLSFLRRCVADRKAVCEKELRVSPVEGKQIINSVLHGGPLPADVKKCDSGKNLLRLSVYMRWLACSVFFQEFGGLNKEQEKRNPDATVFFYMWTTIEDWIVESWTTKLRSVCPQHVSLHFDGVRLNSSLRAWANDQRQFLEECERHIEKRDWLQSEHC